MEPRRGEIKAKKIRKAIWIDHILRGHCLLKHVIEEKKWREDEE